MTVLRNGTTVALIIVGIGSETLNVSAAIEGLIGCKSVASVDLVASEHVASNVDSTSISFVKTITVRGSDVPRYVVEGHSL